jgi:hypothetical protein
MSLMPPARVGPVEALAAAGILGLIRQQRLVA